MILISLLVWLLIALTLGGGIAALALWRAKKLARSRAAWFALCLGGGGAALLFFSTRVSDFIFQQRLVPIDLVSVAAQTGFAIFGLVLGMGIVAALGWAVLRIRSKMFWAAILVAPLLISGVSLFFLRAASTTQAAATPTRIASKNPQVLQDFKITRFTVAAAPTTITVGPDGRVYWAEYLSGKVFSAADKNGTADDVRVFVEGYKGIKGIAFRPGTQELYVSVPGDILVFQDTNGDGTIGEADAQKRILQGLSNFDNEHSNNGIAFGPDGRLYITAGGPRETQLEFKNGEYLYQNKPLDPLVSGILVADLDGKNLKRLAKGMRNPYDLAFDAQGRLFATDNGTDAVPNPAGDELNLVAADGDYGYPEVAGYPPPWSKSIAPIVSYRAHASPDGVAVYDGTQFPKKFRGDIFVAIWSDSERLYSQADIERGFTNAFRGSKIDRVQLIEKEGQLVGESSDFAWDFDHPIDVTIAPDGSMYVADFTWQHDIVGGAIYKIEYVGK